MGGKSKVSEDLFLQGYNCSHAVFAAFSDEVGLDRETALKLASSFGGGMGRLREVCGAVSAMCGARKECHENYRRIFGGKTNMKIAVTTQGDQIFQHFGQCQNFTVFSIEDGKIQGKAVIDASQNGHAALAGFLKKAGVSTLICGGIGGGAKQMLSSAGIELVSGVEGKIEAAVYAYLAGALTDMGGSCNHEDHQGEEHNCSCENHCN